MPLAAVLAVVGFLAFLVGGGLGGKGFFAVARSQLFLPVLSCLGLGLVLIRHQTYLTVDRLYQGDSLI